MYTHIPVMLTEVLAALAPRQAQKYIDCTLGGGGYSLALAAAVGVDGLVLATDLDPAAIANMEQIKLERGLPQIKTVHSNFKNIKAVVSELYPDLLFDGIVMDLGLSSAQLSDLERGFSFNGQAGLNMAFDASDESGQTEAIVNDYTERELIRVLRDYGEENYAGRIAKAIIERRRESRITTVAELVETIATAVPAIYKNDRRLHFATRTFQALRIETNGELENLRVVLADALEILKPGGRLVAVSFHSLEDRIVKQFMVLESKDCLCPPKLPTCVCGHRARLKIITKRPQTASDEELNNNPRSRSAKLRVAQKL
jgi:16S rRNA (cytosine1402-N4)-methyltransferase